MNDDVRAYIDEIIGARFVFVPPGNFTMGSQFAEMIASEIGKKFFIDEAPPHQVVISEGFWVMETEVTIRQFRKFVEETGHITSAERAGESLGEYSVTTDADGKRSGQWVTGKGLNWRNLGWKVTDEHPVTHVSWEDADAFCLWLRDKTGRDYRLLTESEWEYAAGGPLHTTYSWGDDLPAGNRGGNIADVSFAGVYPEWKYPVLPSYDDGYVHTAPVGSYAPNGFGLYDMTGNVWEWVFDAYSASYYVESPTVDPIGPQEGSERVHRGGGFDWELPYLRITKRRRAPADRSACNIGFRIALSSRDNVASSI